MYYSSKNVLYLCVHLFRHLHRHYCKQETLEDYWVSETAKTQSPQDMTTRVRVHRHGLLLLRGEALGGAKIPMVRCPCFLDKRM